MEALGQISLPGWRRADTLKGITRHKQQQAALTQGPLWQRHASEFGVLAAEAAGPGQGQREPLGRGERARQGGGLVQGFTCSKINTGQSVSLCSEVV